MCSAGLICVQTSLNLYAIGNIGTCISLPVLNFPFFLRGSIQTALWEQHLSTVTYISHTTQPSLHNTQFLQLYNDQLFQSSLFFFNLQTFLHLYTCVSGCFWFLAGPIEPSWCCFCVEPGSRPTSRSFGASKAGALSVFSENSEGLSALDTAQNLFLVRLGHRGPNLAIYIANGG
jgi:hypothetical protein